MSDICPQLKEFSLQSHNACVSVLILSLKTWNNNKTKQTFKPHPRKSNQSPYSSRMEHCQITCQSLGASHDSTRTA